MTTESPDCYKLFKWDLSHSHVQGQLWKIKTWLLNMQAKQAFHMLMKDMQESPENYRNVKLFAFEPSLATQPKLQHFEIKTQRLLAKE